MHDSDWAAERQILERLSNAWMSDSVRFNHILIAPSIADADRFAVEGRYEPRRDVRVFVYGGG